MERHGPVPRRHRRVPEGGGPSQGFIGLLKTFLGPIEDESGLPYLRPDTVRGIFVNCDNVAAASRMKPPFGIGQIG